MATAKPAPTTPAATDPPKDPPAPSEAATTNDEALTEKVTAIVKDVLSSLDGGSAPAPESESPAKPLTAREEETRTHNIVAEAIKVFKEELAGDKSDSTTKDKAVTETPPGTKPVRWIEKHLWGAE